MTQQTHTMTRETSGLTQHAFGKLQIQPRTMLIARPAIYFREAASAKRKADAGNKHNQYHSGVHQLDPNRAVSWACQMPDLALAHDTGNAYADSPDSPLVDSKPAYLPYHMLSRAVYAALIAAGPLGATVADILASACKAGGFDDTDKKVWPVVRDTIRDLRNYGFAVTDQPTVTRKASVGMAHDWQALEYTVPSTRK